MREENEGVSFSLATLQGGTTIYAFECRSTKMTTVNQERIRKTKTSRLSYLSPSLSKIRLSTHGGIRHSECCAARTDLCMYWSIWYRDFACLILNLRCQEHHLRCLEFTLVLRSCYSLYYIQHTYRTYVTPDSTYVPCNVHQIGRASCRERVSTPV